jgi:hypothetical protein
MCKICVIPGIKPDKVENAWKFAWMLTPFLTESEKNGFGYCAVDNDSRIFGERWLDVKEAFMYRPDVANKAREMADKYDGALTLLDDIRYNNFGTINKDIRAIMLHGRTATNDINITNTHPFVDGQTALIHNGVVTTSSKKKCYSTCDSEKILVEYLDKKVNEDIDNVEDMTDELSGFFACGVMSRQNDNFILDVFKDDKASLWAAYIEELDTTIFCTSMAVVQNAIDKLGWKYPVYMDMQKNVILRHDIDGNVVAVSAFKSKNILDHYRTKDYWKGNRNEV